jgi:hypothetical protein
MAQQECLAFRWSFWSANEFCACELGFFREPILEEISDKFPERFVPRIAKRFLVDFHVCGCQRFVDGDRQ